MNNREQKTDRKRLSKLVRKTSKSSNNQLMLYELAKTVCRVVHSKMRRIDKTENTGTQALQYAATCNRKRN